MKPESISPIGKSYGRYHILSVIQRGGMGEIFLARVLEGPNQGEQVVLKRLLADFDEDERYRSMFGAEARVMLRMDHPNIVRVFDAPMIDDKPCLAMEFVHGRNVSQILKRCKKKRTPMPPQIALTIALNVLEGLQYAHTMVLDDGRPLDLVHRDVTPGNILVSFDGAVKMTDFGIAKSRMSVVSTTVGVVKGTTRYLSPEQIRSEQVDGRSDLFSAATVLTEMLCGAPLFDRGAVPPTLFAIIKGERKPIADLLPFPAPRLAAALEKALSVAPRDRFGDAAAFADALRSAQRDLGRPLPLGGLGRFVQELFDDRPKPKPKPRAPAVQGPSLDLTYLFEVNERADLETSPPTPTPVLTADVLAEFENLLSGGEPLLPEEFASEAKKGPPPPPPVSQRIELPEFPHEATNPARAVSLSAVGLELELGEAPPPRFPPARTPSSVPPAFEAIPRPPTDPSLRAPYRPTPPRLDAELFREPKTEDLDETPSSRRDPILDALDDVVSMVEKARPELDPSSSDLDAFTMPAPRRITRTRVLFLAGTLCGALLVWGATTFSSRIATVDPVGPPTAPAVPAAESVVDFDDASVEAVSDEADDDELVTEPEIAGSAEARGLIDLTQPRGARIWIDGIRLKRRAPLQHFAVEPGHRRILVVKGRYRRWIEIDIEGGQHLDISRTQIRDLGAGD